MSEQRLVIHTLSPQIYLRTASLIHQPRTHPYTDKIFPTRIKWPVTKYTRDPTTNTLVFAPCCPQYTPWTPPNMTPRLAAQRLADHDRRLWNLSRNADEYRARRTSLRDNWRRKREAWLSSTPSFSRFADLPTELRLYIWELAAQDPGPVDLVVAPFGPFRPVPNDAMNARRLREGLGPLLSLPSVVQAQTLIPLLHVNREAYAVVRPYYRPLNALTQFQSAVPIGEEQLQHAQQQQCDHDNNRGKTVLAAYPTVLHMNQWALTRHGFEATQLQPQPQGSDILAEQRALLSELVIDVCARSFNLYGGVERKLREYFTGAPCLRKLTIKARSNTAGVTCPDLDLLHAFWHFRYWALERPKRVASGYDSGIYGSDWVAPEVAVIVCNPGSGQTAEEDELVLCRCERGLLGVSGLKWNSSPGVTVNSSLDITDIAGILNPVLLPLANDMPDDPGWWA